jgi:hypothetical protein
MATTCRIGFDVAALRAQVPATYDRVARDTMNTDARRQTMNGEMT